MDKESYKQTSFEDGTIISTVKDMKAKDGVHLLSVMVTKLFQDVAELKRRERLMGKELMLLKDGEDE